METININSKFPLVTLFVPSYNHEKYIQDTVQSIIDQSYVNIELLIIDDGSNDKSRDIIAALILECEERFTRFEFIKAAHQGLTSSLNQAINWADGKYFAMLASDDIYYPNKISDQIPLMESDEFLMGLFGGCDFIDAESNIVDEITPRESIFLFDSIIRREHSIITPTQLLRTKALLEVGGYPEELYIEDWYMWLALTKAGGKIKVINQKYVQYRLHEDNMSKNIPKMHKGRIDILNKFQDSKFYNYSKGKVFLGSSIEYSWLDKNKALHFLLKAIQSTARVIFTKEFFRASLRFFVPTFIANSLKKIK